MSNIGRFPLESLSQRDKRIARTKLWQRVMRVAWWLTTHAVAVGIGTYAGVQIQMYAAQRAEAAKALEPRPAPFNCKEAARICAAQLKRG